MWVATYTNTFHGRLDIYGTFDSEQEALDWIGKQKINYEAGEGSFMPWNAREIKDPNG